jgi:Spy/CpxP family protein refolding chaperone
MTKHLVAILCVAACLSAPGAWAQPPQDSSAGPQAPPSPEQVVSMLTAKLSLSEDQKNAIAPIIAERQQKLLAVRNDTAAPRRQRGQEMRQIMSDSDAKINAVLNPDQQAKYAQIEQEMRDHMRHMHGNKPAGAD